MYKDTMTPRERFQAVLKRQKPDRIPMDIWATPEAVDKMCKHFNSDFSEVLRQLHIDAHHVIDPPYIGPPMPDGQDMWGLEYREVDYGTGKYLEVAKHPLAAYETIKEVEENYVWPTVDWLDFSVLPEQVKGHEHQVIGFWGTQPLRVYRDLRGNEQAYMDLVINPELAAYCIDKILEFGNTKVQRIFETVPSMVACVDASEDFGGQDGLLCAPQHIREIILPGMKRLMQIIRQYDEGYAFTHSDGSIREIIPDLIDAGSHILDPIQWRCAGMDRVALKQDFGDKLVFHGAVDNQHTLPFGSAQDVREEVLYNLDVLGKNGGYILAPCHNIQAITPIENILALYQTGYEYGRM